ncbi:S-adenosyl-L-methionine-dependent methyltransferase [Xylariaceae sp. FL0594]|nr:S-adenosyl-L-methionine-dependent methyltransferase [Xylariaceae sp. FL0594]
MEDIISQLEALAASPPTDAALRQRLHNACKKLFAATEAHQGTISRVTGSPILLTVCHIACNLDVFQKLSDSKVPLSGTDLASSCKADHALLSRILRFLASNDLIKETGEDAYAANNLTHTLARPGLRAGIAHSFMVTMPCLQHLPDFLKDTGYKNPSDVFHSAFQLAQKTDQPAYVWAMQQPELHANFSLWMTEQHLGSSTWLDVFDVPSHAEKQKGAVGEKADAILFVDVGGGLGQQCELLKRKHPDVPGRVVLQDQPHVLPHALKVEGMEPFPHDFWTEQPLKGARIYYMRNVLEDYPDERAVKIIENIIPAMLSGSSVLVIDEMIVPNTGASPRSTVQDLTMMATLASAERTERQWDELLERAGLAVLKKLCYNETTGESAIVAVPKQAQLGYAKS